MKKNDLQLFLLELIIILWYTKEILSQENLSLFNALIVLLVYLCTKVIYYTYRKKKFSFYIITSIVFFLILVSINNMPYMAYFIILNITQLISHFSVKYIPISLLSLSLIGLLNLPVDVFILANLLIFTAALISIQSAAKITAYENILEQKNQDNYKLTSQQLNMSIHKSNMAHNARLEERNLIAQKLHDELGHTLSGNTMQLEAALLLIEQDKKRTEEMIRQVIDNLREGSESIRKILKDIQPEHTSLGVQTIKTIISKVREKSHVNVDFIYNNEISQLNYSEWQCIAVNIQEAMTNMMKYSKATKCLIKFERLNKMFKIVIKDNGIGCKNISKGMGFRGMNERTASLNGQLILDGSDGFTIIMLLPIEKGN